MSVLSWSIEDAPRERIKVLLEAANQIRVQATRLSAAGLYFDQQGKLAMDEPHWREAFARIQPVTTQEIRRQPHAFLNLNHEIYYRGATSGTSGNTFVYFADAEWNKVRIQCRNKHRAWWGIAADTPIINLASLLPPSGPNDFSLTGPVDEAFCFRLEQLLLGGPAAVRGYPSRLAQVATHWKARRRPPVEAVFCTGEMLFPFQKDLFERAFKARVINEYGCHETGASALACPEHGRLHLDSERCLFEVIDGVLTTTDLYNLVMPQIRYQCGDRVIPDREPCPCGRPGPTIQILGRNSLVRTAHGKRLVGQVAMPPLKGFDLYRACRAKENSLLLEVTPDQDTFDDHALAALADWVYATFGEVDLQFVDEAQDPTEYAHVADEDWVTDLFDKWETQPQQLPKGGAASGLFSLLEVLVAPNLIGAAKGLPAPHLAVFTRFLAQYSDLCPLLELAWARILVFGCARLPAGDARVETAVKRLHSTLQQLKGKLPNTRIKAAENDLMTAIWLLCPQCKALLTPTAGTPATDGFNKAFLDACLEAVWHHGCSTPFRKLKPLLPVLRSDVNRHSQRFGPWLLETFRCMLLGDPLAPFPISPPDSAAALAWSGWRIALARSDGAKCALDRVAETREDRLQVSLEQAYAAIMSSAKPDLDAGLRLIREHGILDENSDSHEAKKALLKWMPLLRALHKPLFDRSLPQLAYRAFVVATLPTWRQAAMALHGNKYNRKQVVLLDRDATCQKGA